MIYTAAILFAYLLVSVRTKFTLFPLFLAASPLVLFSAMRGSSGKDTYFYLLRFYSEREFSVVLYNEPIFEILTFFAKSVAPSSHEFFFGLHAAIVVFLFCIIAKSKYSRAYLYTVGPMFLIDGITNGMRITIGYHLFLALWFQQQKVTTFFWAAMAHVSMSLTAIFTPLITMFTKRPFSALLVTIFLVMFWTHFLDSYWAFLTSFDNRFSSKLSRYSELVLATRYSGIADLAVVFILLLNEKHFRKGDYFALILNVLYALLITSVLFYAVQQSLAFIRVNKIVIIVLCAKKGILSNRAYQVLLVLIGFAYSANYARQVFSDVGFLPYPGPVDF